MASKYRVSATFDLSTEIEPEGIDQKIDREVEDIDGAEDFAGNSYFSAQRVTCDGGEVAITIEADDEDDAEQKLRSILDEGSEFEDYSGFTWIAESVQFAVEVVEWEPTVEEAVEVLQAFVEDNLSRGSEEGLGRVATAASVVLDNHARLGRRVADLEIQVAGLSDSVRRLTGMVEQLQTERPTESA
jgi:hypothetical protein